MASGRRFILRVTASRWFTIGEHGKVTAEAARASKR
jgi:hypothetical protein